MAAALGATAHLALRLDLRAIGGSALTADIPVPKARDAEAIGTGIPVTYVPARNTIFLSHALAWAEVLDAQDIFIGVNALDYSAATPTAAPSTSPPSSTSPTSRPRPASKAAVASASTPR